jgi:hypothetical protein
LSSAETFIFLPTSSLSALWIFYISDRQFWPPGSVVVSHFPPILSKHSWLNSLRVNWRSWLVDYWSQVCWLGLGKKCEDWSYHPI